MATGVLSVAQGKSIGNAVIDKVKKKGYAVAADLGSLATKSEVAEADLASALANKINGKADEATTLEGYGISNAYTKTEVDNAIAEVQATAAKPGGSLTASEVVSGLLVAANEGKVYNLSQDITTTSDFVDGAGIPLPAGSNIWVINTATSGSAVYKFDTYAAGYGVATQSGNGLMSSTDKTKLDGIEAGAEVNTVTSVAGKTGDVTLAKGDVGLGNVTNDAQVKGLASGTTEDHVVTFGADGYTVKDSGKTIGVSVPSDAVFTDTTYEVATTSANGLMSSTDKAKLDDADVTAYTNGNGVTISNHVVSANVDAGNGLSNGASGIAMAVVSASTSGTGGSNGAMLATDKEKLDGIELASDSAVTTMISELDSL